MKYTNSYKVSVDLKPWLDSGFRFNKVQLYEELWGTIPKGEISLEHDGSQEALDLIIKEYKGTLIIEKEGGNIYEIEIFITNKIYLKNYITLKFVCIPDKKFFTELISTEWDNIDSAIEGIFPGNKDIRCKTDIDPSLKIYQNGESNYSLCKKLGFSYKNESIFGIGWDGLIIKEIIGIDHEGNKEPYFKISGNTQLQQLDSYILTYDKLLYQSFESPWETEAEGKYNNLQAKNNRSGLFYSNYYTVGIDYFPLISNYCNNIKYSKSDMFEFFRAVNLDMPKYKLGDIVMYKRDEDSNLKIPFSLFLVKSNELFLSIESSNEVDNLGFSFSWTSTFVGIQDFDGTNLPKEDPSNK